MLSPSELNTTPNPAGLAGVELGSADWAAGVLPRALSALAAAPPIDPKLASETAAAGVGVSLRVGVEVATGSRKALLTAPAT
jgi:hypothetical protein